MAVRFASSPLHTAARRQTDSVMFHILREKNFGDHKTHRYSRDWQGLQRLPALTRLAHLWLVLALHQTAREPYPKENDSRLGPWICTTIARSSRDHERRYTGQRPFSSTPNRPHVFTRPAIQSIPHAEPLRGRYLHALTCPGPQYLSPRGQHPLESPHYGKIMLQEVCPTAHRPVAG